MIFDSVSILLNWVRIFKSPPRLNRICQDFLEASPLFSHSAEILRHQSKVFPTGQIFFRSRSIFLNRVRFFKSPPKFNRICRDFLGASPVFYHFGEIFRNMSIVLSVVQVFFRSDSRKFFLRRSIVFWYQRTCRGR